jgi:hypothetical protein
MRAARPDLDDGRAAEHLGLEPWVHEPAEVQLTAILVHVGVNNRLHGLGLRLIDAGRGVPPGQPTEDGSPQDTRRQCKAALTAASVSWPGFLQIGPRRPASQKRILYEAAR